MKNIKTQLIVLIGSPGSGKSYYIEHTLKDLYKNINVYDDFFANAIGDTGDMEHSKYKDELVEKLRNKETCVIADVVFSKKDKQCEIIKFIKKENNKENNNVEVKWHCFKKNPEVCKINVCKRNADESERQVNLVEKFAKDYNVPQGAELIETFDTSKII